MITHLQIVFLVTVIRAMVVVVVMVMIIVMMIVRRSWSNMMVSSWSSANASERPDSVKRQS